LGQGRLLNLIIARPQKNRAKPQSKRAKRKGGLGKMNFCPSAVPRSGTEGGKRFRNSALAEYQNRKIFVSLIENNFWGAPLKNVKKIFLFCSPSGERKRWVGLSPAGRQLKVIVGILFKVGSNVVQKIPPFYNFGVLRRYCLALAEFIPHGIYSGAGLGLGICDDFIRIFKIKKQFSLQNLKVRFAKGEHKLKNLLTNLFCSVSGGTRATI